MLTCHKRAQSMLQGSSVVPSMVHSLCSIRAAASIEAVAAGRKAGRQANKPANPCFCSSVAVRHHKAQMKHHSLAMSVGTCIVSAPCAPPSSVGLNNDYRRSVVTASEASALNSNRTPIRAVHHYQAPGYERGGATAAALVAVSAASLRSCSVGSSRSRGDRPPHASSLSSPHSVSVSCRSYNSSGRSGAIQLGAIVLRPLDRALLGRRVFFRVGDRQTQSCRSRASLSSGFRGERFYGRRVGGGELEDRFSTKSGPQARRRVAAQASAAGAAASAPPAPRNFFATLWANFVAVCLSISSRLQSIRIGWLDLLTMMRIVLLAAGAFGLYVASQRAWAKFQAKADGKSGDGGDGDGGPMQVLARGATCLQSNMGPWSIADLAFGLTAMAKVTEKKPPQIPGKEVKDLSKDPNFLLRAQHWRTLSEAVYAKDPGSFSLFTSLPESSLVASEWEPCQETFRPAYAVFVDAPYGAVVLGVRGTSHIIDMLLNSGASPEPFGDGDGYAHGGFVHAANVLHDEVLPHIEKAFKQHSSSQKELKLVVVGHSMGAAIGALISLMLREKWPDLQCWGFCPPACMSLDLAKECKSFTTSFISAHDLVPRISFKSVEKLRARIKDFDWDEVEAVAKDDEDWQNVKKGMEAFQSIQKSQKEAMEKITNLTGNKEKSTTGEEGDEDEGESKKGEECNPQSLHPPGKLLVMGSDPPGCGKLPEQRGGVASERNYGAYPNFDEAKNVTWRMFEAQQEEMEEIVVSPWIVSDHMLGNLCEAISYFQSCCPPAIT